MVEKSMELVIRDQDRGRTLCVLGMRLATIHSTSEYQKNPITKDTSKNTKYNLHVLLD